MVIRCFGADANPVEELATVRGDLLLADLAVVDSALHKAEKRAKGKPSPEVAALQVAHGAARGRDARCATRSSTRM